jgi:hypothetical protein
MFCNYRKEPDYPAAQWELSHLHLEELKELLDNDSKLYDMVKDVKQVSSFFLSYLCNFGRNVKNSLLDVLCDVGYDTRHYREC